MNAAAAYVPITIEQAPTGRAAGIAPAAEEDR